MLRYDAGHAIECGNRTSRQGVRVRAECGLRITEIPGVERGRAGCGTEELCAIAVIHSSIGTCRSFWVRACGSSCTKDGHVVIRSDLPDVAEAPVRND